MKENKKKELAKKVEITISGTQILPPLEGLEVNVNLPTHHVNIVNVMASNDGFMLMSFFTRIPGHNIEQCRVSIPHKTVAKMVDIICKQLNYTPKSPSISQEEIIKE